MARLQRHAWWGLVAMAVIIVLFGVTDIISAWPQIRAFRSA